MPDANLADGDVLTSSFYNTNIREQVVAIVTTATRPTNVEGRHISDTDTGRLHRGDGSSAWDAVDVTPWTAYTPSWTNLTLGDGTHSSCEYRYVGDSIEVRGRLTFGSTTAVSGAVSQAVPASESLSSVGIELIGGLAFQDASPATIYYGSIATGVTSVVFRRQAVSGSNIVAAALSSTAPFTWATGDIIDWHYLARLA